MNESQRRDEVLADILADPEESERAYILIEEIMSAVLGREVGPAVLATLVRRADVPNSELAPSVHRATVSKWTNKIRKNLGWPVEFPQNARRGKRKAPEVRQ